MRLHNKVALITGGTSGIGRETVVLFAREGARVALTGRNELRGKQVVARVEEEGGTAVFIGADVCSAEDCRRAVEETIRTLGPMDILFNNAGVSYSGTVLECTEEQWDFTLDTNLKGIYFMSKLVLPGMIARGGGVIINNASNFGLVGGDSAAAYCASKGGAVLLTRAMAIDHASQGIRVNCICPGAVDTPMLEGELEQMKLRVEESSGHGAPYPLRYIGTPQEIAKAVLFLATDSSSFMNGAALVVDGGATAGYRWD
jgi:NAD(P)-dependent dehydrogenase (short-subunit alcohol dehydrogenase family)